MRKFKNAAIASVAAVALSLSGTTVANAQGVSVPEKAATSSGSSFFGDWLNAEKESQGDWLFGEEKDATKAPAWGEAWVAGLYTLAGGIVAGAILGAFNWAKHEGIII